ncbi:unnamed protein product [Didymodactylos carnosus]|uniref:Uncharacterized protein n=1 Tax=Didymodactylos carnosus TaxID=1234261 RepID=A0A814YI17_9BILA|nr:unnamed protein product [Didymodactylos carnosus]CAF1229806.1 unnamed protein product [Didymodactylos carnosus]CAF3673157.1 unnamed protein product [Didymodactylos carnosus]CAF3992509.1 unnamed protein product [Didymodactylos carnosus]
MLLMSPPSMLHPKPKAVFGLYGIGGQLISSRYYSVKWPITANVADFQHYLNSTDEDGDIPSPVSGVPLTWPIPEEGEKARTSGGSFEYHNFDIVCAMKFDWMVSEVCIG